MKTVIGRPLSPWHWDLRINLIWQICSCKCKTVNPCKLSGKLGQHTKDKVWEEIWFTALEGACVLGAGVFLQLIYRKGSDSAVFLRREGRQWCIAYKKHLQFVSQKCLSHQICAVCPGLYCKFKYALLLHLWSAAAWENWDVTFMLIEWIHLRFFWLVFLPPEWSRCSIE